MKNNDQKYIKKRPVPARSYPQFWEKSVPIFIAIAGAAAIILIVFAVLIIFGIIRK